MMNEPTPPPSSPCGPVVLGSGFGGLVERFRLSLYKLIVFIKGFYADYPPPPWFCGPVFWVWWFNSEVEIEFIKAYSVYKGVLCGLKKVCRRFIDSIASV